MSKLEQLRQMTTVVADTGDIESIRKIRPIDATTNPSLLFKAAQQENYRGIVEQAKSETLGQTGLSDVSLNNCIRKILIEIAREITGIIPGKVSLEVDASLSFDTDKTVALARELIEACEKSGISRERILIKIASTWEGIQAAEELQKEGINCNCTLIFSSAQAIACADAGVYLISPFVGRIYDWYKQKDLLGDYTPANDPGVLSVKKIYHYFKQHNYKTIVMGASFRNTPQIEELAGCDNLTISPVLLEELDADETDLPRKLHPEDFDVMEKLETYSQSSFLWEMNEDAMATEKTAEGIRLFHRDTEKLKSLLSE